MFGGAGQLEFTDSGHFTDTMARLTAFVPFSIVLSILHMAECLNDRMVGATRLIILR